MRDDNKFAFIICYDDEQYMEECRWYLNRLRVPEGMEMDIITVADADSLQDGYQAAMEASDARYKAYLPQDTFVLNRDFIEASVGYFSQEQSLGMMGVYGQWRNLEEPDDPLQSVGKLIVRDRGAARLVWNGWERVPDTLYQAQTIDRVCMVTAYDFPWAEDGGTDPIHWDHDVVHSRSFQRAGYELGIVYQNMPWCMTDRTPDKGIDDPEALAFRTIRFLLMRAEHGGEEADLMPLLEALRDGAVAWELLREMASQCLFGAEHAMARLRHIYRGFIGEPAEDPLVTVVISCYNQRDYIREAIDSVMAQTYENFELVITDDGSTDGSREAIQEAVAAYRDDRIRCVLCETNTCFSCVEDAYLSARGKYISGMGGDDRWMPDKLEKQVVFLENCEGRYQACFTWVEAMGEDRLRCAVFQKNFNRAPSPSHAVLRELILRGNHLCAPSFMMKSKTYEQLGGYDFTLRQLQDYELWLKYLLEYELYLIPEALVEYRVVAGSVSAMSPENKIRTSVETTEIIYEVMLSMPDDLFECAFPGREGDTDHSHEDILCRKMLVLIDQADNFSLRQAGLRLYYQFRRVREFLKRLGSKYGVTRRAMYQQMVEQHAYGILVKYQKEAEGGGMSRQPGMRGALRSGRDCSVHDGTVTCAYT